MFYNGFFINYFNIKVYIDDLGSFFYEKIFFFIINKYKVLCIGSEKMERVFMIF